jgi:prevent-host-death family protein
MPTLVVNAADAKEELAEIINRVASNKERVILTRRGKEVAAIVSIEDLILLENLQHQGDLQDAIDAFKEAREGKMITLAALKDELGYK